jgi:ribosomal protein S18 acetylase RimI-like enzyme
VTAQSEVELRPMSEAEYAEFRERSVQAYADELTRSHDMSAHDALRRSEETFAPTLAEVVAHQPTWLSRVRLDGEPVGWLWLGPPPVGGTGVFVYDIEVDESRRGEGLGRAIMLAAEDLVRDAGYDRLRLNVFGWNERAQSLYRSLGYEVMSIQMRKMLGNELLDGELPDGDR